MSATHSQPPAAGEAAHRFNKFRIVPFAGGVSGLWHDPELMGGYLLAYFNKDHVNAKKAQSVADQLNSHAALVAALEEMERITTADGWNTSLYVSERGAAVRKARAALGAAKGVQS